jgi:hypothetical protein
MAEFVERQHELGLLLERIDLESDCALAMPLRGSEAA